MRSLVSIIMNYMPIELTVPYLFFTYFSLLYGSRLRKYYAQEQSRKSIVTYSKVTFILLFFPVDCESGHDTHGGNSRGECCVFPFLYKDTLYHSCTENDSQSKWCATTPDFNRDEKWGLCFN